MMARLLLRFATLALLASLGLVANAFPSIFHNNIVHLGYASYEGQFVEAQNVTSFTGIRFAAPPTGANRFKAPKPPARTKGIQHAVKQPPQCLQGNEGVSASNPFTKRQMSFPTDSEDCLFLSVTTPGHLKRHAKLPVVVWIHGGGYAQGNESVYHGSDLIKEANGGVVTVTIQYRLGVFGFLGGSEVKKYGSLNAGLLDQNFALQWVREHIGQFGGDPSQVTIWGESAGAGSVLQHIVAHSGKTNPPLFRAAISSSMFLPSQYQYNDPVPEKIYAAVVQQAGCSKASNSFECLQHVDTAVLEAANDNVTASGFTGTFVFGPVIDGTFIVESPTKTLQKGHVNGKHFLAITNSFEGLIFVNATQVENEALTNYVQSLFPTLSSSQVSKVAKQYTDIGLPGTFNQAVAVMGESIFICPTYRILTAFPGNSYKGEFAIPPGIHSEDIFFYFPNSSGLFGQTIAYNNTAFVASFSESFLSFVKTLNPNDTPDPTNITPFWQTYNRGNTEMLFNETNAGQPDIRAFATDKGLLQRCNVWESLAPSIGQ